MIYEQSEGINEMDKVITDQKKDLVFKDQTIALQIAQLKSKQEALKQETKS